MADNLTTFMCRLSWYLGVRTSWYPLGLSRDCFYNNNYHYYYYHSSWNLPVDSSTTLSKHDFSETGCLHFQIVTWKNSQRPLHRCLSNRCNWINEPPWATCRHCYTMCGRTEENPRNRPEYEAGMPTYPPQRTVRNQKYTDNSSLLECRPRYTLQTQNANTRYTIIRKYIFLSQLLQLLHCLCKPFRDGDAVL